MALFIFGAGATRGCSFVKPHINPCLPPLDADFFTQLQRSKHKKNKSLVENVMADVVDLFGQNFGVSMETVFSVMDQTIRMLEHIHDEEHVDVKKYKEMRVRLTQAIATVLEESIMQENSAKTGFTLNPKPCRHHRKFVEKILHKHDAIISFNYDCVLDYALRDYGGGKWNARSGYCFDGGYWGHNFKGEAKWQPQKVAGQNDTIKLLKLHGSLHFKIELPQKRQQEKNPNAKPTVELKERPYTQQYGARVFSIIPPEWNKRFDEGPIGNLWIKAAQEIRRAKNVVVIGYSMPPNDLHSSTLFRTNIGPLKSLVVVNPDKEARKRIRSVFSKGLIRTTKVLSFERFSDFMALDSKIWNYS